MVTTPLDPALAFYATPEEVQQWAANWLRCFPQLSFALVCHSPTFAIVYPIPWEAPEAVSELFHQPYTLLVRPVPIDVSGSRYNEVTSRNRDALLLELPVRTKRGLTVASLGSFATSPFTLGAYEPIVQAVLRETRPGLWKLYARGTKKQYASTVRYSDGAASVCRAGIPLYVEGNITMHLDEPELPSPSSS